MNRKTIFLAMLSIPSLLAQSQELPVSDNNSSKVIAFTSDTQAPMWVETLWLKSHKNRHATKAVYKLAVTGFPFLPEPRALKKRFFLFYSPGIIYIPYHSLFNSMRKFIHFRKPTSKPRFTQHPMVQTRKPTLLQWM